MMLLSFHPIYQKQQLATATTTTTTTMTTMTTPSTSTCYLPNLPNELLFKLCPYINESDVGTVIATTRKLSDKTVPLWDEYVKGNFGKENYFSWFKAHSKEELDTRIINKLWMHNKLFMMLREIALEWNKIEKTDSYMETLRSRLINKSGDWSLADHIVLFHDDIAFKPFHDNNGHELKDGLRNISPAYIIYKILYFPLTLITTDLANASLVKGWITSMRLYIWITQVGCRTGLCNTLQMDRIVEVLSSRRRIIVPDPITLVVSD